MYTREDQSGITVLLADAQLGDDGSVAVDVLLGQVVEQAAALADHHEKAAAGVIVVLVGAQVLGELLDAVGEDGDLDLGGAGIALVGRVLSDQLGLCFFGNHGCSTFLKYCPRSE